MEEKKDNIPSGNLGIYELARKIPKHALKEIKAGRLKGMSDINPMYRIKKMTGLFGPCGIGWKYEIVKEWLESYGNEVKAFLNINLYYKWNGEWSEAIPGTGGSSFVSQERNGTFVNDECVDGDCEVLTPNGWVKFKNYNGKDEICQYNDITSELSFVKPTRFITKTSNNIIDKGGILMTENHRVLCYSRMANKNKVILAKELLGLSFRKSKNGYGRSGNYRDIKCGFLGEGKKMTTIQKIGIMIACDGTLYRTNSDGTIYWRCEFKKERKINRARRLLELQGIKYKESVLKRYFGNTTSFVFSVGDDVNYKEYCNFLQYGNYPELWSEIVSWDGCVSGHEIFSTTDKNNAMYLQTLLTLSGKEIDIYYKDRTSPHHGLFTLYKKKHRKGMVGAKRINGTFDMYCVEVPTSFFMIRKGFDILITGNCWKMALTDAISVATKALGVAADVYYNADSKVKIKSDSKYEQDSNATQNSAAPSKNAEAEKQREAQIEEACAAMRAVKSREEFVTCWELWRNLIPSGTGSKFRAASEEMAQIYPKPQ